MDKISRSATTSLSPEPYTPQRRTDIPASLDPHNIAHPDQLSEICLCVGDTCDKTFPLREGVIFPIDQVDMDGTLRQKMLPFCSLYCVLVSLDVENDSDGNPKIH